MKHTRPLSVGVASLVVIAMTAPTVQASGTQQLCGFDTAPVSGGRYTIQNDEWGSSEPECITTNGTAGFQVSSSAIDNTTAGPPGGYPSIYAGCHWGSCTSGGLGTQPLQVASLAPGRVTSSFSATLPPPGDGAYDVSYDLWINQAPRATTGADGTEVMIWLGHSGPDQPAGSIVARSVPIGGYAFDVWYTHGSGLAGGIVSYVMTSTATSVWSLDLGQVVQDAARRNYASALWYLIGVEAGFEIWQGGAGLAVTRFSVRIGRATYPDTLPIGIGPPGPSGWPRSPEDMSSEHRPLEHRFPENSHR